MRNETPEPGTQHLGPIESAGTCVPQAAYTPIHPGSLGDTFSLAHEDYLTETSLFGEMRHQSQLPPAENKFHVGNGEDGKHYWLTPPALYAELDAEFAFDFDPCPFPLPEGFDGLTCEWGQSNYVNPPFGSIIHQGKKKGPTAWVRKAIAEWQKGKRVVLVYPVDKWLLMLTEAILGDHAQVRNLGDVKWIATEDRTAGKGTGRHIACFILQPVAQPLQDTPQNTSKQFRSVEAHEHADSREGERNHG